MAQDRPSGELHRALWRSVGALAGVAWMSALVNVLTLTGSVFMLEVYDRVIPSRSLPTLIGLCVLALALFAALAMLEALRGRVLARVGAAFDVDLGARVLGVSLQAPLRGASPETAGQLLRDLDQIRAFLASSGPAALFDLPWLPAYVALCFLFHPLIGAAAIVGVGLLVGLTLATDLASRAPVRAPSGQARRRRDGGGASTVGRGIPWTLRRIPGSVTVTGRVPGRFRPAARCRRGFGDLYLPSGCDECYRIALFGCLSSPFRSY